MRYPIWRKDDHSYFKGQRIDMEPSVVSFKRDWVLPLVWKYNFDNPDMLLGHVSDIRPEDGEITCEPKFNDTKNAVDALALLEHGDCRLVGYYSEMKRTREGNEDRIVSARLRSVAVIIDAARNPGAQIKT